MTDIALTQAKNGQVLAHRADCPEARKMAAEGLPVMTMFSCSQPLPADIERHSCLEECETPISANTKHRY